MNSQDWKLREIKEILEGRPCHHREDHEDPDCVLCLIRQAVDSQRICENWFYISDRKFVCSLQCPHEGPHQTVFDCRNGCVDGKVTVSWPLVEPRPGATVTVQIYCTGGPDCRCGAPHRETKVTR
jgi:hypothetical protein